MVKIKVPGTSANIGPGSDTLGLALNIFNEIIVEKKNSGIEVLWDIPNPNIPLEENLVYVALIHTLKKYKKEHLGCTIRMTKVDVPISRGLGSSAAAIVCGIYAAHYLMDYALSTKEIRSACFDVYSSEPPKEGDKLLALESIAPPACNQDVFILVISV